MFKFLNRLILLALAVVLVAAVYAMQANMTQVTLGHETFLTMKWPWLREVREICTFATLGWCLLFLRGDPVFARIGLVAVIIAFALMVLPPHLAKELPKDLPDLQLHH